jgi:hypothetical protein
MKSAIMQMLSKSKYLAGLQCKKLLWHHFNAKDQFPLQSDKQQNAFDQGREVGNLAKLLYPKGIEVSENNANLTEVIKASEQALKKRRPLFEAGFQFENAFARSDILIPAGKDGWDIMEVKSSTKVSDLNLQDLAFQSYVYSGTGLKIHKCYLLHINNQYVRKGKIQPPKLFCRTDVTAEVNDLLPAIGVHVQEMNAAILLKAHPPTQIGIHCDSPYPCPLKDVCWKDVADDSVFTLYRSGKKAHEWFANGYHRISDLPESVKLSTSQSIQVKAEASRKPYLDHQEIRKFLSSLEYPLYFLDFETFSTAIPIFNRSQPYQQIPFQYSLHVVQKVGMKPRHFSFLADGASDPRRAFLDGLVKTLGDRGSIVTYNATFEQQRLKEVCELFPAHKAWLTKILDRVVDLLIPFRSFHYYHPKQQGSASIKAVLPALVGKGYDGLEIADGGTASAEFLRMAFGNVPARERKQIRKNLEEYCALDTLGMVWIVNSLGDNLKITR